MCNTLTSQFHVTLIQGNLPSALPMVLIPRAWSSWSFPGSCHHQLLLHLQRMISSIQLSGYHLVIASSPCNALLPLLFGLTGRFAPLTSQQCCYCPVLLFKFPQLSLDTLDACMIHYGSDTIVCSFSSLSPPSPVTLLITKLWSY